MIPAQEWAAATTRERCLPLPEVIVNFISADHSFPLFQYITTLFLCFTISALFFFVSLPHATFPLFYNNINQLFQAFPGLQILNDKMPFVRVFQFILYYDIGRRKYSQLSLSNCPPPPQ